jgi:hypothetical protein
MDHDNSGGWSFDGVCCGVVYPSADSCYLGYDKYECDDDKFYVEYYFWFESCVGGGCDGYHNICGGLCSDDVYKDGFRVMK